MGRWSGQPTRWSRSSSRQRSTPAATWNEGGSRHRPAVCRPSLARLLACAILTAAMIRSDGRRPDQLRPVTITPGYLAHAEGSALIEMGNTSVLCAVSVEDRVPRFALGSGSGWITAEYGMLPRSTLTRTPRETSRTSGRTSEIQRLIGRSLRSVAQLDLLGERTFVVDCDVIKADGGTRTAAISGAYVALQQALHKLKEAGSLSSIPLRCAGAAVSAGVVDAVPLLDLNYE